MRVTPRRAVAAGRDDRDAPSRAWRRRAIFNGRKGRTITVRTDDGRFRVRILAKRERMRDVPLATVYPQLADVLRERARERGLGGWLLALQRKALDTAVCERDVMPRVGAIDAARAVPFLNLSTLR